MGLLQRLTHDLRAGWVTLRHGTAKAATRALEEGELLRYRLELRPQLRSALALLTEILREPSYPADQLEIVRKETQTALTAALQQPSELAVSALARRLLDLGREARGRAVDHDRGRILSPCRPLARCRLRIEVDHKGGMPGILSGCGQMQGEGGLARAALLADDRNCWHVNILT